MSREVITHARLLERLKYDPQTGVFTWRITFGKKAKVGEVAGKLKPDGRWYIGVDYKEYQRSRLAWYYMTGEYPVRWVDHENRIPSDDRWLNLRQAIPKQNNQNSGKRSDNTSGVKGVSWNEARNLWHAYIQIDYRLRSLGFFERLEDAAEIATFAREFFFGEFYADLTK